LRCKLIFGWQIIFRKAKGAEDPLMIIDRGLVVENLVKTLAR